MPRRAGVPPPHDGDYQVAFVEAAAARRFQDTAQRFGAADAECQRLHQQAPGIVGRLGPLLEVN